MNRLEIVALEIVEGCNLKCDFCARNAEQGNVQELEIEKIEFVIEHIKKENVNQVALTGGEPLLHSKILDIVKLLEMKKVQYSITTNGTILNRKLLEFLSESKYFKHFIISLDSYRAEVHDKIRGVLGTYKIVQDFIRYIRKCNIQFCINMTVNADNLTDIYLTAQYAKKIGAKDISVAMVRPDGRGTANFGMIEQKKYAEQINECYDLMDNKFFVWASEITIFLYDFEKYKNSYLLGEKFACSFANESLHIDYKGNIKGCATCNYNLGNIYENDFSLGEFWKNNEIICAVRNKSKLSGVCGKCEYKEFCGGCRCRAYAVTGDLFGDDLYCPIVQGTFDKGDKR